MIIQKTRISICFVLLTVLTMLTSCVNDNEPADKQETITLYVSATTGQTTGLTGTTHECMLVKEKGQSSWNTWEFQGIKGFIYEKGYDYELLVMKTIYANPPADGGSFMVILWCKLYQKVPQLMLKSLNNHQNSKLIQVLQK